ncbi:hypothetical protein AMTR_s00006p00248680 [Amborella trichopoda]|uniref:Uncharacterized protein n=1 Tax=Amborella trichopoda TaxID=13333 RepID=W1PDP6_AMBTC|nr:hypothetical protein AMTR_s00006p00248680 [Amborella trichopoda]
MATPDNPFIGRSGTSKLDSAQGMNVSLRAQLVPMNFVISQKTLPSVIVGEWCRPFIFIKEKGGLDEKKDQLGESIRGEGLLKEKDSTYQRHDDVNGFVWFETADENGAQGGLVGIGLSKPIMEK